MPKTMSEIQTMFADGLVDKPPLLRSVEDKQNLVREAVQALCDHILDKALEAEKESRQRRWAEAQTLEGEVQLTALGEAVVLNNGPSANTDDDPDSEG